MSDAAGWRVSWRRACLTAAHWWAALALLLCAWSGMLSARDQLPALRPLLAWWPGMDAPLFWHVLAAAALLPLALAWLFWRARHAGPVHAAFSLLRWAMSGLAATGLLLWSGAADGALWRLAHLGGALVLLAGVAWHSCNQLGAAGRWRRLQAIWLALPARLWQSAGAILLCAGVALVGLHGWQGARSVRVPYVQQEIIIDGQPDEAAWQRAASVEIETWYGAPQRQRVPLQIKLLHDGYSLFMQISWPDATRSRNHLPLRKTAHGWQMLQDGWTQNDELTYYEDKLAVMLGTGRWDALRSVFLHNGADGKMRGGHHGPDGRLLDLWHWKSVRNHGFANLDDAYFGSLLPHLPGSRRYAWGYASDPISAGGFKENFRGHGMRGALQPLRLPRDPAALAQFQQMTGGAADAVFALDWHDSQPWHASLDHYPLGTLLPSVVQVHANEGDRADVRAAGAWRDGRWTLETVRALNTGSNYDVALQDGVNLWFAVFDHTQTRHAWHLRPLRLEFAAVEKK
ncbi:ethylbenzene dehydrogenase-related protein [Massilia sp. W12]|uniref:ethylbenzene dehydrogenase-related protein n=1 Tax=Massilia sp. W12 TaxID=3126507 RepID=UPI0030CDE9D2